MCVEMSRFANVLFQTNIWVIFTHCIAAAKNNFKWVNILIVYWFLRLLFVGLSKHKEDVDPIGLPPATLAEIGPTLRQHFVLSVQKHCQIQLDNDLMMVQCCTSVVDDEPTLNQYWLDTSCLLGDVNYSQSKNMSIQLSLRPCSIRYRSATGLPIQSVWLAPAQSNLEPDWPNYQTACIEVWSFKSR